MKRFNFSLFIFLMVIVSCKSVNTSTEKPLEVPLKESNSNLVNDFNTFALAQHQKGVDFYAMGEDASWTLALDFDNEFHFTTSTGISYTAAAVEPAIAADFPVKRYRTVTDKGELIVEISFTECTNGFYGSKQTYKVSVNYKTTSAKNDIDFKGCGTYIPDFRLHNIWAIIEVDGLKINPSTYKNNAPILEINSLKQTVLGADGCNTLRGIVYNQYNQLYFNKIMGTRMACDDAQQISSKINDVFNTKGLTYALINNLLIITKNNQKLMVLKHID